MVDFFYDTWSQLIYSYHVYWGGEGRGGGERGGDREARDDKEDIGRGQRLVGWLILFYNTSWSPLVYNISERSTIEIVVLLEQGWATYMYV